MLPSLRQMSKVCNGSVHVHNPTRKTDRKFGDWTKPLRVRWSSFISEFFVCFVLDAVRSLRQSMSLMTRIESIDKGEFVCSCWWPELYLRVLLYFFRAFFSLFLYFMVYSVETVTEAFWALIFFILFLVRFPPPSPRVYCCFAENCDA